MKVLVNNYNESKEVNTLQDVSYPRKFVCETCNSKLEYDKSDIRIGALGCVYINCPCCGYESMIEEHEDTITLTKDNIKFPDHFFHSSKDTGAIDCCDNENIKNAIERAINFFRKNKDEFTWSTEGGNLNVTVWKYDGDENYYVVVADNYYSTYIPFEKEDYKCNY